MHSIIDTKPMYIINKEFVITVFMLINILFTPVRYLPRVSQKQSWEKNCRTWIKFIYKGYSDLVQQTASCPRSVKGMRTEITHPSRLRVKNSLWLSSLKCLRSVQCYSSQLSFPEGSDEVVSCCCVVRELDGDVPWGRRGTNIFITGLVFF